MIADRSDEQVQPKLAATTDGGMYVSWFDNAEGGYDVALQRLDADGREQWPHNGIAVADLSYDWTMDYGLAVDAGGNAVLAFRDDRTGRDEIAVAMVSAGGAMIWGEDGIRLPRASEDVYAPSVTVSTDGFVWVAWSDGLDARLTKLDAKGGEGFDRPVTFSDPDGAQLSVADLEPADAGAVIVSWVRQKGFPGPRHLYAQKVSADGRPMWGAFGSDPGERAPVAIFEGGTLQMGNFPEFSSDGAGGAVFAWYEVEPWLVRAQWIRADGTAVFPDDGVVAATTEGNEQHVEPALAFDRAMRDIYVFFRRTFESGMESQRGFVGQRITSDGPRWGERGVLFEGDVASEITQLTALPADGGVTIAYVEALGFGDQRIWVRRVSAEGKDLWPGERVAIADARSGKSRLAGAQSTAGFAVFGWQDTRGGKYGDDLYVQNVLADGSLGPVMPAHRSICLPRLERAD